MLSLQGTQVQSLAGILLRSPVPSGVAKKIPLLPCGVVINHKFYCFLGGAAPHSRQDLSSSARDGTRAPCSGSAVLTNGLPGSPSTIIFLALYFGML